MFAHPSPTKFTVNLIYAACNHFSIATSDVVGLC